MNYIKTFMDEKGIEPGQRFYVHGTTIPLYFDDKYTLLADSPLASYIANAFLLSRLLSGDREVVFNRQCSMPPRQFLGVDLEEEFFAIPYRPNNRIGRIYLYRFISDIELVNEDNENCFEILWDLISGKRIIKIHNKQD